MRFKLFGLTIVRLSVVRLKSMKKYKKLLSVIALGLFVLALASIYIAGSIVENSAEGRIYNSVDKIPHNKVGLVLGTGKILPDGRINLYYRYRIDAAVELFESGKIDYILVSGDNSSKGYDEPSTIKEDLILRGVPADKIFLDYAGFRTLDSVVRSKEIFGQDSITIISQQFHNERALYIAKRNNIEAIGFNARDVNIKMGFKVQLREKLARVKMIIDLIIGKQPKFLGDKINIE
ncbi:MAG: vancomycin high temperature exclusion protein [Hyphomicrobiales bacterium]